MTANTKKTNPEETTKNIYGHVLFGILSAICIILFIFCMLIILQRKVCFQIENEGDHENGINKFVHEGLLPIRKVSERRRFHTIPEIRTRNIMSQPRLSVNLENGRYANVQTWKNEPRLDLREREMRDKLVPTKKGISLRLHQIKVLSDRMEFIEEALRQNEEKKFHLGFNVFVSLRKDNPCVDIRQYWKPPNHNDVVPTRRGLCLRPVEYNHLKTSWEDILKNLPEMETFVLCYDRNDHLNQMGMLQCPACNP